MLNKRLTPGLALLVALASLAACARREPEVVERIVEQTVVVTREVVRIETVVVPATPTPDPSQDKVTLDLRLDADPLSIDPALLADPASGDIVENLFLGLTRTDAQGNVQPELASAWSVSPDGLTWTFTLRDDAAWVTYTPGSGVTALAPVTAQDVVYAVQRTCDPRTGAENAALDYIIAGCEELQRADLASLGEDAVQALIEALAVEALDDYTVQFTLDAPAGYFPALASLASNRPLYQPAVEHFGAHWTEPGNIVSNGPYLLADWFHGDHVTLERNPLWYGWSQAAGNVERVELAVLADQAQALAMYQAGRLDSIAVSPEALATVQADPALSQELAVTPALCSEAYGFVTARPPLDDPLVRKALSAAIDRQSLAQQGGGVPANTFAPAGVFGSAAGDPAIAPWAAPEAQGGWGYARALQQAQAWLAQAGYPGGAGFPGLRLLVNNAPSRIRAAQAIQAMWQAGLGIDVALEVQEWRSYLAALQPDAPAETAPHVWAFSHCGALPDQAAWLHGAFAGQQRAPGWQWDGSAALTADGRSFDELIEAGQASADPEERRALYREAETILTDTFAAIAPLYYYSVVTVTQPYLTRGLAGPGGNRYETWLLDWPAKKTAADR